MTEPNEVAAPPEVDAAITEYAVEMGSGDMVIRYVDPDHPEWFQVFLESRRERGIPVYRRRVIVVEDWTEVTDRG